MKRMTTAGRTAGLVLTVLAAGWATGACTSSTSGGGSGSGGATSATQAPTQAPSTGPAGATDSAASAPASLTPSPRTPQAADTAPGGTCAMAALGNGTWTAVPGSSGAGHTSADIAFQNTSSSTCTISGFPGMVLRDASGNPLPTHVTNFATSPAVVSLAPGAWVHSELRYSPDIPGPGEPTSGPCEADAVGATVQIPGDSKVATVKLDSPTAVCEQGAIEAKEFTAGKASPAGG